MSEMTVETQEVRQALLRSIVMTGITVALTAAAFLAVFLSNS